MNCVTLFSSMTGRKNKRIQRRCHETAAKAPTVPLSVQLYDQQPAVKLVLIFLNTFDLESCLLCYTIFFSLISTHDTGAQSILAEMYFVEKEFLSGPNAFMRKNVFIRYWKAKRASNRANKNANGNLRPLSVTFIFLLRIW